MITRLVITLLLVTVTLQWSVAQTKGTGLIYDKDRLNSAPTTAPNLSRGINIPVAVSLRQYAPTPGDQGATSTCVAWATAYHGRTILESIIMERTDQNEINGNTFSPSYVYNQIRFSDGCEQGTYIDQALDVMIAKGVTRYNRYGFNCSWQPNEYDHKAASTNRILDYKLLFNFDELGKVNLVKNSLAHNYPVVFAMFTPPSFYPEVMNGKEMWISTPGDYDYIYGCHAMITIGYDDNKNGGSFLIMNSWGTNWGDNGFAWITYQDYQAMALYAFEMIGLPQQRVELAGKLSFRLESGSNMKASYQTVRGLYKMDEAYSSGTQFQFWIDSDQPAYVYAFGSDDTKASYQIFPYDEQVSPYLAYDRNSLAFPAENKYVALDETKGHDFFCVLFSTKPLDFDKVLKEMPYHQGGFYQRLKKVLGDKLANPKLVQYNGEQISFSGKGPSDIVIPIIVSFDHI